MFHSSLSWIATSLRRSAYERLRMDPVRGSARRAKATALLFTMVSFALVSLAPVTASAGCIIGLSSATCSATAPNPSTDPIGAGPEHSIPLHRAIESKRQSRGNQRWRDFAGRQTQRSRSTVERLCKRRPPNRMVTRDLTKGAGHDRGDQNGTITVDAGAAVIAKGVGPTSEAINPFSYGNTIINHGLITGGPSSAIVFENVNSTANSPRNTVLISASVQATPIATQSAATSRWASTALKPPTGLVQGDLSLQGGNDNVTVFAGSKITGSLDGGGGANSLALNGTAGTSDTMSGSLTNFSTLTKTGAGTWTLSGAVGDNLGTQSLRTCPRMVN